MKYFLKMTIIYSKKLARYMTKEYIFVKKTTFFLLLLYSIWNKSCIFAE